MWKSYRISIRSLVKSDCIPDRPIVVELGFVPVILNTEPRVLPTCNSSLTLIIISEMLVPIRVEVNART